MINDLGRPWRVLVGRMAFADHDSDSPYQVHGNLRRFELSRKENGWWVALTVAKVMNADDLTYAPYLESDQAPVGTGVATELYLRALYVAQQQKAGWQSDGILSTSSHKLYQRLIRAGVPFYREQGRNAYLLSADSLAQVDLDAVSQRLVLQVSGKNLSEADQENEHMKIVDMKGARVLERGVVQVSREIELGRTAPVQWCVANAILDDPLDPKGAHVAIIWHGGRKCWNLETEYLSIQKATSYEAMSLEGCIKKFEALAGVVLPEIKVVELGVGIYPAKRREDFSNPWAMQDGQFYHVVDKKAGQVREYVADVRNGRALVSRVHENGEVSETFEPHIIFSDDDWRTLRPAGASMSFYAFKHTDDELYAKLSALSQDALAVLADQAIEQGYDGEDLAILQEVLGQHYRDLVIPIFHEHDQATAKSLLLLEAAADARLDERVSTTPHP